MWLNVLGTDAANQLLLILYLFVLQYLLSVKDIEAKQMECVTKQHGFNLLIERTRTR